ncbi:MAG: DUF72 domain-containing protein [Sulfolobales archaeon]
MREIYVGTSGWLYSWNLGSSLDWYVKNSGLNAVELNASFYRYPFRNQISSWAKKGSSLRWSIKIHRSISHLYKLSEKSLDAWRRFRELFDPMSSVIDFYLLQLPPNYRYSENNVEKLRRFIKESGEGSKLAIEFREASWFTQDKNELCEVFREAYIVSVDSPEITWFISCRGIVYLRLHGRTGWYFHDYSSEELEEIASEVINLSPKKIYVFFNNDHWMLENARKMLEILSKKL